MCLKNEQKTKFKKADNMGNKMNHEKQRKYKTNKMKSQSISLKKENKLDG